MAEREINGSLGVRSVRSSIAGAWVRSSGWSEIELGGACSRRRSYAVVADGKYPGLVEERGNRKVREEKRKNEEERGNQRMREEKRKKMKREEREKEI